jgi:hypothetical protein
LRFSPDVDFDFLENKEDGRYSKRCETGLQRTPHHGDEEKRGGIQISLDMPFLSARNQSVVSFVASISLTHFGQYHGAGVFTGFGLRLLHLAQRNRLPFTAVFGRVFLPLLGKLLVIEISASF